jgi:hypothetical protein
MSIRSLLEWIVFLPLINDEPVYATPLSGRHDASDISIRIIANKKPTIANSSIWVKSPSDPINNPPR